MTAASTRPTRVVVDLAAVRHNVAALRELVAPARLCVVVKADGYRHGAVAVASAAVEAGADELAVAVVEEGLDLRRAGIERPILVLSEAPAEGVADAVAGSLSLTVATPEGVAAAASAANRVRWEVPVHVKVDTGMHRVGCEPAALPGLAAAVAGTPGLALDAVWTHLAVADDPHRPVTARQLHRFDAAVEATVAAGTVVPRVHVANSAGAIAHPAARRDMVRCGIAAYGLPPAPGLDGNLELRPAMSVVSAVTAVRRVAAGEGVSYGHRFVATEPTTIATVPVGYADGVPRALGLRGGEVLVRGGRRPIAGAVTMDQLMVDCGDEPVEVGDEVVLLGRQGGVSVEAWEWAGMLDTIAYEVVCGFGSRAPRRYR